MLGSELRLMRDSCLRRGQAPLKHQFQEMFYPNQGYKDWEMWRGAKVPVHTRYVLAPSLWVLPLVALGRFS